MSEIHDLLEFAEAKAAGKHFELAEDNRWIANNFSGYCLSTLEAVIENGRVRTKAEVITLTEYRFENTASWNTVSCMQGLYLDNGDVQRLYMPTGNTITGEVKDD